PPCPSSLVVCFFFFQAEDGIRDFHVTGVQTCALPISAGARRLSAAHRAAPAQKPQANFGPKPRWSPAAEPAAPRAPEPGASPARSGERRVGQGGRGRGRRGEYVEQTRRNREAEMRSGH